MGDKEPLFILYGGIPETDGPACLYTSSTGNESAALYGGEIIDLYVNGRKAYGLINPRIYGPVNSRIQDGCAHASVDYTVRLKVFFLCLYLKKRAAVFKACKPYGKKLKIRAVVYSFKNSFNVGRIYLWHEVPV